MTDPMRLCILGNSHIAAAKDGWEQISAEHPGVEATFFGAPWDMMRDVALSAGKLVAQNDRLRAKLRRTSNGLEEVVLADYDAVVLWGLQFGPRPLVHLYRSHRPLSFEWPEPLEDLAPLRRRRGPVQRVSERLFERAALAALGDSLAVRLASMVAEGGALPMALVAAPGFSARVLDTGDWDGVLGAGDLERLAERYRTLARRAAPDGVRLILPREALTVHGLFTAPAYAAPDGADGNADHVHTSGAYAAEMLTHALAALARLDDAGHQAVEGPSDIRLAG